MSPNLFNHEKRFTWTKSLYTISPPDSKKGPTGEDPITQLRLCNREGNSE